MVDTLLAIIEQTENDIAIKKEEIRKVVEEHEKDLIYYNAKIEVAKSLLAKAKEQEKPATVEEDVIEPAPVETTVTSIS